MTTKLSMDHVNSVVNNVISLRKTGKSITKIAEHLGVDIGTVFYYLKKCGYDGIRGLDNQLGIETPKFACVHDIYSDDVKRLKQFIKDVGSASLVEMTQFLYEKSTIKNKIKTQSIVQRLRKESKKNGEYFYAVNRRHQFLTEENWLACTVGNKDAWADYTYAIQDIIQSGARTFPRLRKELTKTLGEMNLRLLEGKEEKKKKEKEKKDQLNNK